jgi:hypothetical protein
MQKRHFISDDLNSKLWVSGLVPVAMWLASVGSSRGEVLASWDFGGGLLSPSFLAVGVGGSVVSASGSPGFSLYVNTGNPEPGIAARGWLGGRDAGRYFSFGVRAIGGLPLVINRLEFDDYRSGPGTGPTSLVVQWSADQFSNDLISAPPAVGWTHQVVDFGPWTLLPLETLEFRMIAWGANNIPPQGGYLHLDNLVVSGTVVPEPSAGWLLGGGFLVAGVMGRWRRTTKFDGANAFLDE